MRNIKQLQEHLKITLDFQQRYPGYDLQDRKIHVLYVHPYLTAEDYYSCILAALELNTTNTHRTLITEIAQENTDRNLAKSIQNLDNRLLVWADYIVFPTLFTPLDHVFKAIRYLYPRLKLVMCWNRDITQIEDQQTLLTNMHSCDFIMSSNEMTFDDELLKKYCPELKNNFFYIPPLISSFGYQCFTSEKKIISKALRIGIFGNGDDQMNWAVSLLKHIYKTKDMIKPTLIFMDYTDSFIPKDLLDVCTLEFSRTVPFDCYTEHLQKLQLDVAVLSATEHPFYKSIHTYLELMVQGSAMIIDENHPAVNYILENKNGLIARDFNDWAIHLYKLITNNSYRKRLSEDSQKIVWRDYSFDDKTIKILTGLFL